jgi:GxxExxY protein
MPITVQADVKEMLQKDFSAIAYEVVHEAFALHRELGPLFSERAYRNALTTRLKNARTEVQITVAFENFEKSYFMDVVVGEGAIFEIKAVESLNDRHRSQLLNYLLLAELKHGKLINFGPENVEHEFVNTTWTGAERANFSVEDGEWLETEGFGESGKTRLLDVLRDWGVGLDRSLYEDLLIYLLGGERSVMAGVDVFFRNNLVAQQPVALCGSRDAVWLTTFPDDHRGFQNDLNRLAKATALHSIQWINIGRRAVSFRTLLYPFTSLHISVPNISV